jgi:EAL domain-containing protein (putative c-di-GMP-specific phosphodiesterase class I)
VKIKDDGTPPRIAVVDDDAMVANTLTTLLTRDGYTVAKFGSAGDALDYLGRERVDAVLSDVSMPGMTGLELLEKLRAVAPDVPVVFVTGAPRIEDTIRAMELGAFRYLMKPIDRDAVRSVMAEAVKWGRLARATSENPALEDRAKLEASFSRVMTSVKMVYQPIVSTNERTAFGYEALMRSAEPALPSPPDVLDAAEKLGRLHSLGRQLRSIVASQAGAQPFDHAFFVNLHSADLADPDLFDAAAPLSAFAKSVVLEITERASLEGIAAVDKRLETLRDMGYRIAVDDLGAGYAGLSYFARLSPDVVKIDMSLTRGIERDAIKQRVVGSMCQLARDLDMLVVAEGIETEEEFSCVSKLGADLVQGYVVAKPGPYPASS